MKQFTLVVLLFCSACATPTIVVKQNVTIEKLGIYFEAGDQSIAMISRQFSKELDFFIQRYNGENHRLKLFRASKNDSTCLQIKLVATRLVSPGQQATGVVLSIAGLSLPIVMAAAGAPFYVGFYYFPKVQSMTQLSLSPDIAAKTKTDFVLASPGFLMPPEGQMDKHTVYFGRLVNQLVVQIEKQTRSNGARASR